MISINNIFKIFLFVGGFVLGAFLFKGCGKPCTGGTIIKTVIKRDTVQIREKDTASEWHHPAPYGVPFKGLEGGDIESAIRTGQYREVSKSKSGIYHLKPFGSSNLVIDTTIDEMASDYFNQRDYSDTIHFRQGDVIVQNSVAQNKLIKQRALLHDFKTEFITQTNTVTQQVTAPKHNELYLGFNVVGNLSSPVYAFGPSAMFKLKNDKVIQVSGLLQKNGFMLYQGGIFFKLSLKNK